jgi:hypothetical protein
MGNDNSGGGGGGGGNDNSYSSSSSFTTPGGSTIGRHSNGDTSISGTYGVTGFNVSHESTFHTNGSHTHCATGSVGPYSRTGCVTVEKK